MNVKGFRSMTLRQDITTILGGTKINVSTGTPGFIQKKYEANFTTDSIFSKEFRITSLQWMRVR